jgi:hypothetical protein
MNWSEEFHRGEPDEEAVRKMCGSAWLRFYNCVSVLDAQLTNIEPPTLAWLRNISSVYSGSSRELVVDKGGSNSVTSALLLHAN